ncbi:hypothetical protein F2Q69_00044910 [Brassica cretica]|uniref:Uncharacterized protein n=1 Tax=Brassica cretica TaxID=69181 RepID=A0A8S9NRY0_BRACR|nr:hypothetical protein F2Q69_00044910 [Brassica cretica]
MFLSGSLVPQTGVPASVTQPSRSLWESRFSSLMKRFRDSWFTPVGRATSLKAYSIVKVDRFEVAVCSSIAPEINLQSRLDCLKSPSDCEHKPRTPRCGWANPLCPGL